MTYEQIEREVRLLVNDTESPFRFAQEDIFRYAVIAVRHLRNVNRSEEYGPNGLLDSEIPAPSVDQILETEREAVEAVAVEEPIAAAEEAVAEAPRKIKRVVRKAAPTQAPTEE